MPTAATRTRASPASTSSSTTSRTQVDLTVTIAEGEPVRVAAVDFRGFDVIPADHLEEMKKQVPLKVGQPRDRQLVVATHELAVNELQGPRLSLRQGHDQRGQRRDQASVADLHRRTRQDRAFRAGRDRRQQERRRKHHPPPADLQAGRTLPPQHRAGLAAPALRDGAVPVREHRAAEPRAAAGRRADAGDVAEGNHQRVNFGVGYGTEEKARVDAEYHHVNFLGGARSAGAARALVVARSRRPRSISTSRTSSRRTSRSAPKRSSGTRSRPRTSRSSPAPR